MPAPEVSFDLLDGTQAAELTQDLAALHAEVCPGPLTEPDGGSTRFARRFRTQCRQPGFMLAAARSGGYLVGCAAGMPLRPSTSWWRDLTAPLAEDVAAERPGRTFALVEFGVRASWRRQGIGRFLVGLTLQSRSEERATVVVPPGAHAAQAAFQNWGWRRVARTRNPDPGAGASDVLLLELASRGR